MAAIAAEECRKNGRRKRRAREREHAGGGEEGVGDGLDKMGHPLPRHTAATLPHNGDASDNTLLRPTLNLGSQCAVAAAAHPFRGGGGCTFGSGRGDYQHVRESPVSRSVHATTSPPRFRSCSSYAAWGPHERNKLNEICERISFVCFLKLLSIGVPKKV